MKTEKLWQLAVNNNKIRKSGLNKKMIACREKGILYEKICYHCGKKLLKCKKYNTLCNGDCND